MLYYDKMGILKPEFIAKNGYRYYSTPQYLTLEIILLKMDISVPDIREFLRDRSRDNILKILDKKKAECLQQIQEAQHLINSLDVYRKVLESSQTLPLNQVLLQSYHDCRMFLTPIPKDKRGGLSPLFPSVPAMCGKPSPIVSAKKDLRAGSSVKTISSTAVSTIPRRWLPSPVPRALTSPATISGREDCISPSTPRAPISTTARNLWTGCRILWIGTALSPTEMCSSSPSSATGLPITRRSISTPSA